MRGIRGTFAVVVGASMVALPAWGVSAADTCEAGKLKTAGKCAFCRLLAEANAIKTAKPVDYSKCDSRFALKWQQVESSATCSTTAIS
jgi:hypothetical protein